MIRRYYQLAYCSTRRCTELKSSRSGVLGFGAQGILGRAVEVNSGRVSLRKASPRLVARIRWDAADATPFKFEREKSDAKDSGIKGK